MDANGNVKLKIVSPRGHDELLLSASEAVQRIEQETEGNGKWLYVDGEYTSVDAITERDLEKAQSVILTDRLAGGAEQ